MHLNKIYLEFVLHGHIRIKLKSAVQHTNPPPQLSYAPHTHTPSRTTIDMGNCISLSYVGVIYSLCRPHSSIDIPANNLSHAVIHDATPSHRTSQWNLLFISVFLLPCFPVFILNFLVSFFIFFSSLFLHSFVLSYCLSPLFSSCFFPLPTYLSCFLLPSPLHLSLSLLLFITISLNP
jgi:hypothetical protein